MFLDRPLEKFEGEPDEVTGLRRKFQNAMDTALPTVGKARRLARESERGFLWQQLFLNPQLLNHLQHLQP